MAGRAQASVSAAPTHAAWTKTVMLRRLWRLALWGSAATGALLIAALATRSEIGTQRVAGVLSLLSSQSVAIVRTGQIVPPTGAFGPPQTLDADPETRRLADTVRGLVAQNDELKSRLAAIEHAMDDVTGSVSREIEAAKAGVSNAWPSDAPPAPPTPADIATIVAPVLPPPDGMVGLPPTPLMPSPTRADASATQYGVDIGGAVSIQALRQRWAQIRATHVTLFTGLRPTVTLSTLPHSNQVELHLVVGPLANAAAALQLCGSLAPYRLYCKATILDGRHLALQ
jgi:hypothetical protein